MNAAAKLLLKGLKILPKTTVGLHHILSYCIALRTIRYALLYISFFKIDKVQQKVLFELTALQSRHKKYVISKAFYLLD